MNTYQTEGRWRRRERKGERGFTLMEILVALAIVGIIIGITAAALGGRATTTRLQSVASQVGQTVQGRQQLFLNELRSAHISMAALATELQTVFSGSTIITSVASDTAGASCTTGTYGVIFTVATLTADESEALQPLILTAVANIFDGVTLNAAGGYQDVFFDATQTIATTLAAPPANTTATSATTVNLCIG